MVQLLMYTVVFLLNLIIHRALTERNKSKQKQQ